MADALTGAAETPLQDLLRRIPRDAIYRWTTPEADRATWQRSSSSAPIGRLAHEAADRLDAAASPPAREEAPAEGAGVYVASRASIPERGQMWRDLRASGVNIISSWIDEDGPGETADFADLWPRIQREVTGSERLVCYLEPDDFPIKGVLIEIGMAFAASVPVFIVAPGIVLEGRTFRPLGSWIKHPAVTFCDTVEAALSLPVPDAALRNRTSEPEAGESEPFMWAYEAVTDGEWRAFPRQLQRADGSICPGQPLYTHPAPASADKLRVAKVALERIATVDLGGGFLGAGACRQVAQKALAALNEGGD